LNWHELQLNDRGPARAPRDDTRYTKGYLKRTLNNDEYLAVVEKRFLAAHPDNDVTARLSSGQPQWTVSHSAFVLRSIFEESPLDRIDQGEGSTNGSKRAEIQHQLICRLRHFTGREMADTGRTCRA
jgi:hypothetical protein